MIQIKLALEGFENFAQQLSRLRHEDIQASAFSGSASGAALVRDRAKRNVQTKFTMHTGRLLGGIFMKKEKTDPTRASYVIGVRRGKRPRGKTFLKWVESALKGDPYYWFFLEFGTVHITATPFLRPALEEQTQQVAERIRVRMRDRLKRNKLIK